MIEIDGDSTLNPVVYFILIQFWKCNNLFQQQLLAAACFYAELFFGSEGVFRKSRIY